MVKLVPGWFAKASLPLALGVLSLSYVFGGAIGTGVAGLIARVTNDNWRLVLGLPSVLLVILTIVAWLALPRQAQTRASKSTLAETPTVTRKREFLALWRDREFVIICALSFALTFVRETFGFWTVDYFRTEGGAGISTAMAAFLSMPFDICGALGILAVGWGFGVVPPKARGWLLSLILCALALVLLGLPLAAKGGTTAAAVAVGAVGFLACGPYSLLAGVLAVGVRGAEKAATVAGWVDGVGYAAGVLSGAFFGRLLTWGGYPLGFQVMAGLTLVGAIICLFLGKGEGFRRPTAATSEVL
jgi:OPA family sugar phosphate sensor protein UhpC-like MFS transporter